MTGTNNMNLSRLFLLTLLTKLNISVFGWECTDAFFNFYGGKSCSEAANDGDCTIDEVASHCPLSCDACLAYGCEDSLAPFIVQSNPNVQCAVLAGNSNIDDFCTYPQLASTCRSTCDYCADDRPSASPTDLVTFNIWDQVGPDIDGEDPSDRFGTSIDLSSDGTRIVIGAPYYDLDGNGCINYGLVRVFQLVNTFQPGGNWFQLGQDLIGSSTSSGYGETVAMSNDGNRIIVGAKYVSYSGYLSDVGQVQTYEFDDVNFTWVNYGSPINGVSGLSYFGESADMAGDGLRIIVGQPEYNDDYKYYNTGHAYAYEFTNGEWQQLGGDLDGESFGDFYGLAVAISNDGSTVAIGAPYNNANGGPGYNAGSVRVFELIESDWVKLGVDIDGAEEDDNFGDTVALSGDGSRVAIGSDTHGSTSMGHVRVFDYSGTAWVQTGSDIDGSGSYQYFGASVDISGDGSRVIIGSPQSGGNSGYAYVYELVDGDWEQLGNAIEGERGGDSVGLNRESVSISNDGGTIGVGAPRNDDGGYDSGHVRVYNWT